MKFPSLVNPPTSRCFRSSICRKILITYSNFSNTTQEFHLWLPIKVTYIWGDIYTTVQVTVKATQGNGGTGTNGSRQAK